ncbi:MAG: hypothetical protein JGK27_30980 [Microcoleus sp. PH2017_20_SFW_D_A]|uniref:hypothetical protein n=1 Tax=Microcoleus sp. PH2017_28_MFU_U_A TaxID=2798838 RepID=UPI001D288C0C|nr:hypothetical protein [Microcoleus sp. PH2017_28_MFU_U_A]MCC3506654.1 hypothetical protein [Microcoleus sp. PH2017_19_SFW_U_A]MCC3526013.1 hypothetical protein [Microcoleus sp. PH2017_20_SFW_D_A]MCC3556274.1 hypothetical protein [Microcoleus sp. PH2017_35_SFW_U_B]
MNRLILSSSDRAWGFKPNSYRKAIVRIFRCQICCPWRMGCVSFLMRQVAFEGAIASSNFGDRKIGNFNIKNPGARVCERLGPRNPVSSHLMLKLCL